MGDPRIPLTAVFLLGVVAGVLTLVTVLDPRRRAVVGFAIAAVGFLLGAAPLTKVDVGLGLSTLGLGLATAPISVLLCAFGLRGTRSWSREKVLALVGVSVGVGVLFAALGFLVSLWAPGGEVVESVDSVIESAKRWLVKADSRAGDRIALLAGFSVSAAMVTMSIGFGKKVQAFGEISRLIWMMMVLSCVILFGGLLSLLAGPDQESLRSIGAWLSVFLAPLLPIMLLVLGWSGYSRLARRYEGRTLAQYLEETHL